MENTNNTPVSAQKKRRMTEERLEIVVAIFLGVTALLMAWSTWIGGLHGGNQATNYTMSNNLAAEGNAEYNAANQSLIQDMITWNSIMDYATEQEIAELNGNAAEAELIEAKMEKLMNDNCSSQMLDAIIWASDQEEDVSPFEMEGFFESYYEDANALLAESQALLEQGQKDNTNGDKFGLVSVIYSVVLFLLGIVGVFKRLPNRVIVFWIAIVMLVIGTIYMLTIPLPTGFSIGSYFQK
ncbi:MAG: hypothetical protein IJG50_00970 [Clostridia bacterium]|nr:hypothetical protein [Clostridia bacterium]